MKFVSVHGILKFKQFEWLKKYIDFNTNKRKNAVNSFEKDFLKLMNNIVYGKAMENLKKKVKIRLVNNTKDYKKICKQTKFCFTENICRNFVAIHQIKPVLTLDKPIYAGCSILDLNKLLMYDFIANT